MVKTIADRLGISFERAETTQSQGRPSVPPWPSSLLADDPFSTHEADLPSLASQHSRPL
jgi:hypothetical protein